MVIENGESMTNRHKPQRPVGLASNGTTLQKQSAGMMYPSLLANSLLRRADDTSAKAVKPDPGQSHGSSRLEI